MKTSESQRAASRRYYYRNKSKIKATKEILANLNRYTPSKTVIFNGEEITCYSIKYLALKLGVKPDTIRKWERRGIIPKTHYISKDGRRYYTEAMIDLICHNYELFKKNNLTILKFKIILFKAWEESLKYKLI